ncbi:7-carboxy-7-deazaguanine synthase QueE [Kineosporia sp. NBRC 101731]|uniref:7-carboxy-7-deazaguanine synthase QueE n=1 Tax=Kineosporia sp. NBRC 101731 TaxID=3032199 RepID=UPI0025565B29|nr:7-carboxy-7-deazaguanine synthase QueE [Kineosporia sp. NBRC 101731]
MIAGVVGPTVHPQGRSAGRRCVVVQMGGCNLSCTWCDSAFTWDTSRFDLAREVGYWRIEEIAETARSANTPLIVISGGEPLQQQNSPAWPQFLELLGGYEIGVETNGTFPPTELTLQRVSWVTVSPKLAHSGDPAWSRINRESLVAWGQVAQQYDIDFSFAVRDLSDIESAVQITKLHELPIDRIWIVPEATTAALSTSRLAAVSEAAVQAGFNLSARLSALTNL